MTVHECVLGHFLMAAISPGLTSAGSAQVRSGGDAANLVTDCLRSQYQEKKPNVRLLKETFDDYDRARETGNRNFEDDVQNILDGVNDVLLEPDAVYRLLPCVLYLIRKLQLYATKLDAYRVFPGNGEVAKHVNMRQLGWRRNIARMPASYDSLLVVGDPNGIGTCRFMHDYDILQEIDHGRFRLFDDEIKVLAKEPRKLLEHPTRLQAYFTFVRLDVKLRVAQQDSGYEDIWPKYFSFDWPEPPTKMRLAEGVLGVLKDCRTAGFPVGLTNGDMHLLLTRMYAGTSLFDSDTATDHARKCIQLLQDYALDGQYDYRWLYMKLLNSHRIGQKFALSTGFLTDLAMTSSVPLLNTAFIKHVEYCKGKIVGWLILLKVVCNSTDCSANCESALYESLLPRLPEISPAMSITVDGALTFCKAMKDKDNKFGPRLCHAIMSGTVKLDMARYTPEKFGELVDTVDDNDPAFIETHLITILKYLLPVSRDSVFIVLRYCRSLSKVVMSDSQLKRRQSKKKQCQLPERFTMPDRSTVPTAGHLEQYLVGELKHIFDLQASCEVNSLAYTWWRELCEDLLNRCIRSLSDASKKAALETFTTHFVNNQSRPNTLQPLEWMLYSKVVPELISWAKGRLWEVDNVDVLLCRCETVYTQLKDSGNILDGGGVPDDGAADAWLINLHRVFEEHHRNLSEKSYNETEGKMYVKNIQHFNRLFRVFGRQEVEACHIPAPSSLEKDLQSQQELIGWLQNNRVVDLESLICQLLQVKSNPLPKYCEVANVIAQVNKHLESINVPLQGVCDTEQGAASVKDFLRHFVLSKSLIFSSTFKSVAGNSPDAVHLEGMLTMLSKVHRNLLDLLSCEAPLSYVAASGIRDALKVANIEGEIDALCKFPLYQTTTQSEVAQNLRSAFEMLQYISCAPEVLKVFKVHGVVDVASDDKDIQFVSNLEVSRKLKLKEVHSTYATSIGQMFRLITCNHLALVKEVSEQGHLLYFFRQEKLHNTAGRLRWNQLRQRIKTQVRGNPFKTNLLHSLNAGYQCLSPFMHREISFRRALQELGSTPVSTETIELVRIASNNIAQIRIMWRQAQSRSIDNMLHLVETLEEHGFVTFHLRSLFCCPSSFDFSYEIGESASLNTLDQEQIRDLRRQLILCKQDEHGDALAAKFEATLKAVDDLKTVYFKLEDSGHIGYQASSHQHDLYNMANITKFTAELTRVLDIWRSDLQTIKEEYSIMMLFSNKQIGQLLALLAPGNLSRIVTDHMTHDGVHSRPALTDQPPEGDEKQLVIHCVLKIVYSACPVGSPCSLSKEEIDGAISECIQLKVIGEELLRKVCSLVMHLIAPAPVDSSAGTQTVCDFSSLDEPSTLHTHLLSVFLEDGSFGSQAQVLHCTSATTGADLEKFLLVAGKFPDYRFLLLGLDKLHRKARTTLAVLQRAWKEDNPGDICYVFVASRATQSSRMSTWIKQDCSLQHQKKAVKGMLSCCTPHRPKVFTYRGCAGQGKSTAMRVQLGRKFDCIISINDKPDVGAIVRRLNSVTETDANIYFNISAHAPLQEVDAIFFQLLVLGSLVDQEYGLTFSFPLQSCWIFWVEVPHREGWIPPSDKEYLSKHLPMLAVFSCEDRLVTRRTNPFRIAEEEVFVARYIAGYNVKDKGGKRVINSKRGTVYPELLDDEYQHELVKFLTENTCSAKSPQQQHLFVRYLHRRFQLFTKKIFLLNCDTQTLGSDLMEQFVSEAEYLCQKGLSCSWEECKQSFCISDGGTFCPLYPTCDGKSFEDTPQSFQRLTWGGEKYLKERESDRWECYLAWSLSLSVQDIKILLKKKGFVLTPDFAYKMMLVHERKKARIPLVIEGDTGVGKTFLLEMYAILLNKRADKKHSAILISLTCKWLVKDVLKSPVLLTKISDEEQQRLAKAIQQLSADSDRVEDIVVHWTNMLELAGEASLPAASIKPTHTTYNSRPLQNHPTRLLQEFVEMTYQSKLLLDPTDNIRRLASKKKPTSEESIELIRGFLTTPVHPFFWRFLVHPGVNLQDIEMFLRPVVELADKHRDSEFVVFFDEVNTASCLGLFKEILMDGTINGVRLPDNLFFVSAINPHEEKLVIKNLPAQDAIHMDVCRQVYIVHKLPDTMESILWKYGSLQGKELAEYIRRKIVLQDGAINPNAQVRDCLDEELQKIFSDILIAAHMFFIEKIGPRSVSQRDIHRVFLLLPFFLLHVIPENGRRGRALRIRHCIFLAIGVVYYLRLPEVPEAAGDVCRSMFLDAIPDSRDFIKTFNGTLSSFVTAENFCIPDGIAINQALKENIFAIIACVQTNVPIGLVGAPGSSKTLSFHIVRDNLLGPSSPTDFCRKFEQIDTIFYQCSEHSDSNEIKRILDEAVDQQAENDRGFADSVHQQSGVSTRVRCVVLLDEAGLPKEDKSNMVLKVLHPYLDECKIAFVAISNRHFDSANQNRMVTVLRSLATHPDLVELAEGCIGPKYKSAKEPAKLFVRGVCQGFLDIIQKKENEALRRMFHYRDLVYLWRYIHCLQPPGDGPLVVDGQVLLQGLERNFNGVTELQFHGLVEVFFSAIGDQFKDTPYPFQAPKPVRSVLDVLRTTMGTASTRSIQLDSSGKAIVTGHPLAPRFKMIIDPTDDHSAIRLLEQCGLLGSSEASCKKICMSSLPGDCTEMHAAETVADIKYYLEYPITVALINASRIYSSLYDLLNQNFPQSTISTTRSNEDIFDESPGHEVREQVYANIALGSVTYTCPVDPQFQCVVFVKECELLETPAPLLSRFEKYMLPVKLFLEIQMCKLEESTQADVRDAYSVCQQFVQHMGASSFYGYTEENTLSSLFFSHIRQAGNGERYSEFELYTPALRKLQEEPHQTIVMRDCPYIQKVVRCVCAELLQLMPPEVFLLKLPSIVEADVYAHIYFKVLENNIVKLVEHVTEQVPDGETKLEDFVPCSAKKLMVFTRTSGSVLSLHTSPEEVLGKTLVDHVTVVSASDFECKNQIDKMLKDFGDSRDKTCCVITADTKRVHDLRIWHQLVSSAQLRSPKGVSKSYILIFHFPEAEAHYRSCYAASFLNGWNCLFLDVLEQPAINLHNFADVFVKEVKSNRQTGASVDVAKSVLQVNDVRFIDSMAAEFVKSLRGVTSVPSTGKEIDANVSSFYKDQNQQQKISSLRKILQMHPSIWEHIKRLYFSIFDDREAFMLVRSVAVDIRSQKIPCSFATEVNRRVQKKMPPVFKYVLWKVCVGFGLAGLANWSNATLDCILKLLPSPNEEQCEASIWRIPQECRTVVLQVPLHGLIKEQIARCIENCSFNTIQGVYDCLRSNARLSELLTTEQSDSLQLAYCNDQLLLTLVQSRLTLKENCVERAAVKVVIHWLRLQLQEAHLPNLQMISALLWAQENQAPKLRELYQISLTLILLGYEINNKLEELTNDSSPFDEWLLMRASDIAWNSLSDLSTVDSDVWAEKLGKWISACNCIAENKIEELVDNTSSFYETRPKVLIVQAMSKLLLYTEQDFSRAVISSISSLLSLTESQSVLESIIQHLTDIMRDQDFSASPGHLSALLDLVLYWVESGRIVVCEVAAVLKLVNGKFCSDDMCRYKQVSIQIVTAMVADSRLADAVQAGIASELCQEMSYVPPVYSHHDPASQPLSHVAFELECLRLIKENISQMDLFLLQQPDVPETQLLQSVEKASARHVLVESFVKSIVKYPRKPFLKDSGSGKIFNMLINDAVSHFSLSPASHYSLYMLKTLLSHLPRKLVMKWLQDSDLEWCKDAAAELAMEVKSISGLSFMFSTTDATGNQFYEGMGLYQEMKELVARGISKDFSELVKWCTSVVAKHECIDRLPTKSWLKCLLLLVAYHEYFVCNKRQELAQLFTNVEAHLDWTPLQKRAFLFFTDQRYYNSVIPKNFGVLDPEQNDDWTPSIHHAMVNQLACYLFLSSAKGSHWTTLLTNPKQIKNTLYFGATTYNGRIIFVKIDCCCQFLSTGESGSVHANSCLSQRGIHISTFFTFTSLFWHTLLEHKAASGDVLSQQYVKMETDSAWPYRDRLLKFCYDRVCTQFHHICNGSMTQSRFNAETCASLLTRCMEGLVHHQTSRQSVFLPTFKSEAARHDAEKVFQRDIVERSFSLPPPAADTSRPTELQTDLEAYCLPPVASAGFHDMAEKFPIAKNNCSSNLNLLDFIIKNFTELRRLSLMPKLLKTFAWLHTHCSCGKYSDGSTLADVRDRLGGDCIEDGIDEFNELHHLSCGKIRLGACGDPANYFSRASLSMRLKDFAETIATLAIRSMECQSTFFKEFKKVKDEASCAPEQLLRVVYEVSSVKSDLALEALDHARGEGLLKVSVANFQMLAQRYSFQTGRTSPLDFDWFRLQQVLAVSITNNAFNIDNIAMLQDSLLYATVLDGKNLQANETLGPTLHKEFKVRVSPSHEEQFIDFATSNLRYQTSYSLLHCIAEISRHKCSPEGPPSEVDMSKLAGKPLVDAINEFVQSRCSSLTMSDLEGFKSLNFKLEHISAVHELICNHLRNKGYLRVGFPEAVRSDIPKEVKSSLKSELKAYLGGMCASDALQELEVAVKVLLDQSTISQAADTQLSSVLSQQGIDAAFASCFSEVRCQNIASVFSLLVRCTKIQFERQASDMEWKESQKHAWSDAASVQSVGRADNRFLAMLEGEEGMALGGWDGADDDLDSDDDERMSLFGEGTTGGDPEDEAGDLKDLPASSRDANQSTSKAKDARCDIAAMLTGVFCPAAYTYSPLDTDCASKSVDWSATRQINSALPLDEFADGSCCVELAGGSLRAPDFSASDSSRYWVVCVDGDEKKRLMNTFAKILDSLGQRLKSELTADISEYVLTDEYGRVCSADQFPPKPNVPKTPTRVNLIRNTAVCAVQIHFLASSQKTVLFDRGTTLKHVLQVAVAYATDYGEDQAAAILRDGSVLEVTSKLSDIMEDGDSNRVSVELVTGPGARTASITGRTGALTCVQRGSENNVRFLDLENAILQDRRAVLYPPLCTLSPGRNNVYAMPPTSMCLLDVSMPDTASYCAPLRVVVHKSITCSVVLSHICTSQGLDITRTNVRCRDKTVLGAAPMAVYCGLESSLQITLVDISQQEEIAVQLPDSRCITLPELEDITNAVEGVCSDYDPYTEPKDWHLQLRETGCSLPSCQSLASIRQLMSPQLVLQKNIGSRICHCKVTCNTGREVLGESYRVMESTRVESLLQHLTLCDKFDSVFHSTGGRKVLSKDGIVLPENLPMTLLMSDNCSGVHVELLALDPCRTVKLAINASAYDNLQILHLSLVSGEETIGRVVNFLSLLFSTNPSSSLLILPSAPGGSTSNDLQGADASAMSTVSNLEIAPSSLEYRLRMRFNDDASTVLNLLDEANGFLSEGSLGK